MSQRTAVLGWREDSDEPPAPSHSTRDATLLSLVLHLPAIALAIYALFYLERLPEAPIEPEIEVSFLEPRQPIELLRPIPPAPSRDQPARELGFQSKTPSDADERLPPGDPRQAEALPAQPEAARSGEPDRSSQSEDEPRESANTPREQPPATPTRESVPDPVVDAPNEPQQERDPLAPRTGRPAEPNSRPDDDLPPNPRLPREGQPGGTNRGLELRQKLVGGFQGDVRFDNNDYPWDDYSRQLYWAIYRRWLNEMYERTERFKREQRSKGLGTVDADCAIHFVIHRNGTISDAEIVYEGVLTTLADSAKAAVESAVISRLPDDAPRDREGVTFTFRIYGGGTAWDLEESLRRARHDGVF